MAAQRLQPIWSILRLVLPALVPGVVLLGAAQVGRYINEGLVSLIGNNVLTAINLAAATFVLDHAALVFGVITAVLLVVAVVEARQDRLD